MPIRKLVTSLASAVIVSLALAGGAQAATVANTNDSGPGSLRQAISDAGQGETITVPAGTYTLTSKALEIKGKSLTIAGNGAADTVIRSGGPFGSFVILGPAEEQVTISGVTIRDGTVGPPESSGAGLVNVGAKLTLRGVAITNNTANANGAPGEAGGSASGAAVVSVGWLTLIESTVSNNLATAVGGSGKAGGSGGAAILVVGSLNIQGSTIADNRVDVRGGQGPASAEQNGGVGQAAGLVAVVGGASFSIADSTISGNLIDASAGPGGSAGQALGGGVVLVVGDGRMAISNTTIASNVARAQGAGTENSGGAGMYAIALKNGSIALTGSTIAGNRLETESPKAKGGNLFLGGQISFADTIVSGGVGPAGTENCIAEPPPTSLGFNIDSLDQCGFKAAGDRVNTDPLLGPLASNGGLTQTMAPALASPAIDQGAAFGLSADQRGVVRPIDLPSIPNSAVAGADGSDIGAVEIQPSNAFTLGKLKKNKKKGTATLAVSLPAPSAGTLTLSGKGLKTQTLAITGQTEVKLKVAAKSKAIKKALKKKGKRKVKIDVTYTPTGNTAATKSLKAKLVKKKKRSKPKKK